jgi:myo-inositol 2-dehydrogenase/D-chiro-inositol 1-dehydrogenase
MLMSNLLSNLLTHNLHLHFTAAKQFNVAKFTSDAMDVITDPEVDAVWICSPSQFHAEQIKAAAANGKHVFCEKPIATDLPETVEAINACNQAGVKLMIGLQRRFDENFKRVKTAVSDKEVGETIMVRVDLKEKMSRRHETAKPLTPSNADQVVLP